MQISDEMLGEMIYRALYQHQGGLWECVSPRHFWYDAASRLRAALSALSLPVQPVASVSAPSGELAATTGEDKYRAWCEVKRAEFADDPADLPGILRMLDRWGPEALPADDNGQVHFARSLLDSAAEAIRKHLATTPPVPPTKGPEDDLRAALNAAKSALIDAQEELRLIRMKDTGAVYDTVLRSLTLPSAIRQADEALALRSRPASALPVVGDAPAWADVIAERKRQVEKDGWTPEHDDAHSAGQMAYAASAYARPDRLNDAPPSYWPWEREWWKPGDRRRDLVKAGALILAEIERLDRASSLTPSVQP